MAATPDSPLPDFNAMTRDEILAWVDQPGNLVLLMKYGEPGEPLDLAPLSPEDAELLRRGLNPPGTPEPPG